MSTKDEAMTVIPNGQQTVVSGSLFDEWLKSKYPLMHRDQDYAELDYTDIQDFGFWIEKEINSGRFSNYR